MKVERDDAGNPVQVKVDKKTGRVYRYPVADGKVPEDWWTDIETLNRSDRERTGWPSQKPQRLLERPAQRHHRARRSRRRLVRRQRHHRRQVLN